MSCGAEQNSPLSEPPILAIPGFGLSRTRGHQDKGQQADEASQQAFDQEQIPPSRDTVAPLVAQFEDARSEESADNVIHIVRHPEPSEAERQLVLGVEVGKIEDDIGDEAALEEAEKASVGP